MKTAAALAGALLVAACGGQSASPTITSGLAVVTTTTVFADFVAQVGRSRVTVTALLPRGADVHTFQPSASDAQAVGQAGLLVANGLGLDDWRADSTTPTLKLAEELPGADYITTAGARNPHLWMKVTYARGYASLIATELIQLDPAGKATYDANLAAYDAELVQLDTWIRSQIAPLTPYQRRVISLDTGFAYFADAYGLELTAVDGEGLVAAIENSHARALLSMARLDDGPLQAIVDATRVGWAKDLYDESLGDAPIDSYEALMRWDTNQITRALK